GHLFQIHELSILSIQRVQIVTLLSRTGTPSTDKVIGIAPVSAVGMIVTCHMPQRDPSSGVTETTVAAVVEDRNSVAVMTCCGVSALPLLMPSVAECGV